MRFTRKPSISLFKSAGLIPISVIIFRAFWIISGRVNTAGIISTIGMANGGLTGWHTIQFPLAWMSLAKRLIAILEELDPSIISLFLDSVTALSSPANTLVLRGRISGTHSWRYTAPVMAAVRESAGLTRDETLPGSCPNKSPFFDSMSTIAVTCTTAASRASFLMS